MNNRLPLILIVILLSAVPISYAQSPNTQLTKKQLRQQKKEQKQQQRQERRIAEEQLKLKADSIKISTMLQLRNTTEAEERDSLKRVMKNSKKLAKESSLSDRQAGILKSEEAKQASAELDPYLTHYKQYKSKLVLLDSGTTDDLLSEGKQIGLKELSKNEEYKSITPNLVGAGKDLQPYTKELKKYKGNNRLDSASREALLQDAKQLGLKEFSKKEEFKEVKKELTPYLNSPYLKGVKLQDLDSMSLDSLKALSVSTFEKLEKRLEQELLKTKELSQFNKDMAELEALKGLPESYRKQFEAYKNNETVKNEALTKAAQEAQMMLAKNTPALTKAQTDLAKLKKKYSSVPSSDDLSTATKRSSLKGQPFKSRLVIGGNFQVVTTNPVTIDISPILGYRFNKDFYIAVGGTYRARFSSADSTFIRTNYGRDELTYGYRVFTNYRFWKAFYAHAEYERISKEFAVTGTDRFERIWKPGILAGIGSSYTIKGTLKGNVSLLYNFLHDDKQRVYQSPWVFRFGFDLALE